MSRYSLVLDTIVSIVRHSGVEARLVPLTRQNNDIIPRASNNYTPRYGYFRTESNPWPHKQQTRPEASANVSPALKSCELVVVGELPSALPSPAVPHGRLHGFSPRTRSASRRVEAVTTAVTLGLNLAERKGPSINSHCRCDTTGDRPVGRSL